MFGWREKRGNRERPDLLDILSREVFESIRVTDDEIDETALSPELYSRVRSRIATRRRQAELTAGQRIRQASQRDRRYLAWGAVAAALLLALTFAVRLTRHLQAPAQLAVATPHATQPATGERPAVSTQPTRDEPSREAVSMQAAKLRDESAGGTVAARHHRTRRGEIADQQLALLSEEQQATEFLPLTLTPDEKTGDASDGMRQIVRVTLPRTTLLAFGVPMNMERAGELVTADVMLGEDGVARAIRFVH